MYTVDFGAGNIKMYGPGGGVIIPAHVATPLGQLVSAEGLAVADAPLKITGDDWAFYTGLRASTFGRPVRNLSDARFASGTPETRALVYAAMSRLISEPEIDLIVGLPQSALARDVAQQTADQLRGWLAGRHTWSSSRGNGSHPHTVDVGRIAITSQTAGALFDYLLHTDGSFRADREAHYQAEVGIITVGMNTIELQVTRGQTPIAPLGASITAGVRRLLDLADQEGYYSRDTLDARLRAGTLRAPAALATWGSEVVGHIEEIWGETWRRFAAVIIVGGGARLIQRPLSIYFEGRASFPPSPVQSVARGMYKLTLLQAQAAK